MSNNHKIPLLRHNRKKPLMRPRAPLYFCTYLDERGVEQIITYSQTLDPERARTWTGRHRVLMLEAVVVEDEALGAGRGSDQ